MDKKTWEYPQLILHGSIESITCQVKLKLPGAADDFGQASISGL